MSLPLLAQSGTAAEPPETVRTSITVIERITAEAPAFVSVLDKDDVEEQPGVNLDDRLRSVPGFTLFRRSSSLVANPTTQGVSLRGLGSSAASRTLLLWDGVPLNSPFGGWVYWTRVAPEELERVEVSRGASTSLFGDRAMSGAITLFSRPEERRRLTAGYEGGNRNTHLLTGGYSDLWSRFGASANIRAFTTDGYYVVRADRRGSVDTPANVQFVAGNTRLDYLGGTDRLFVKLDVLAEERENGTTLTENSTSMGTIAGQYSRQWNSETVSLLGYHTREQYHSSFSAVGATRNTEAITFLQTVPSQATGAAGYWRHGAQKWNLVAGGDVQRVSGTSTDRLVPTGIRIGSGSQLQHGLFGQADLDVGPARLFLGARHQFTGQDSNFFSPSAGFVIGRRSLRARGSVYRSFRAPTLNELYRDFRVGNAETRANPALLPEETFGAEAGVDWIGENSRIAVTVYRLELQNLITNVTLSTTPQLIVRQRQNAAEALARGAELSAERRWGNWRAEVGYLFADSRFSNRRLLPQVPRHQGMAQVTWARQQTLASVGIRSYSSQFEDDLNTITQLEPGFASVQIALKQRLVRNLSAQLAVENLLDREYIVGYTPIPLIGPPRLWRAGLRWDGRLW
jgi:outer membrane receptor protein involved in Fe transport